MDEQQKQFIKGFNSGYLMARYEPDLFAKLQRNLQPSNDYVHGLVAGGKEHELEKSRLNQKNLNQPNKPQDKEIDKER